MDDTATVTGGKDLEAIDGHVGTTFKIFMGRVSAAVNVTLACFSYT